MADVVLMEPSTARNEDVTTAAPTTTLANDSRKHRTVLIERRNGSFGFSIQSYGIQYRRATDVEVITYIDRVDAGGPAREAGLREGDVILSINGQDMESCDHHALVASIRHCPDRLRMNVVFENCVRKVCLHMRYIQLQRQLSDRMYALEQLREQEKHFMAGLRAHSRGMTTPAHGASSHAVRRALTTRRPQPPPPQSVAVSCCRVASWRPTAVVQPPVTVWRPAQRGLSWDNICQLAYCEDPAPPPPRATTAVCPAAAGFPVLCRARSRSARSAECLLTAGGGGSSQFDTSCFKCRCVGALTISTVPAGASPPSVATDSGGGTPQRRPPRKLNFFKPKSMDNLLAVAARGCDVVRRADKWRLQKQQRQQAPSPQAVYRRRPCSTDNDKPAASTASDSTRPAVAAARV